MTSPHPHTEPLRESESATQTPLLETPTTQASSHPPRRINTLLAHTLTAGLSVAMTLGLLTQTLPTPLSIATVDKTAIIRHLSQSMADWPEQTQSARIHQAISELKVLIDRFEQKTGAVVLDASASLTTKRDITAVIQRALDSRLSHSRVPPLPSPAQPEQSGTSTLSMQTSLIDVLGRADDTPSAPSEFDDEPSGGERE